MRLWSLHPSYLDRKGLVALWRESLLARAVLAGTTRGYRHHPQLVRFRGHEHPVDAVNAYLKAVWEESTVRGFRFDRTKLAPFQSVRPLAVTAGQLWYELDHLRRKLEQRDPLKFEEIRLIGEVVPRSHPLFTVIPGDIEPWEKQVGGDGG